MALSMTQLRRASEVRLRRSTAIVTEHVLDLRTARDDEGRRGTGPPPVAVACEETLLAAAIGKALVRVDGVDADEQVRQLLTWAGRQTVTPTPGPPSWKSSRPTRSGCRCRCPTTPRNGWRLLAPPT